MPYFNGVNIFGVGVKMVTADNPRAAQENAFPGLSGVESLDQGDRGRFTSVVGMLVADTPADLGVLETLFRSYNDGNTYVLTDAYGFNWPNVKLESFEPQPPAFPLVPYGWCRRYTARFRHLT